MLQLFWLSFGDEATNVSPNGAVPTPARTSLVSPTAYDPRTPVSEVMQ